MVLQPSKKVNFAPPTIFYVKDSAKFKECRVRYWEIFAIDRARIIDKLFHSVKKYNNTKRLNNSVAI